MRVAAILGLGASEKDLKPFQLASSAIWAIGMPADSAASDAILVFGGDGTIHRHLAQLVELNLPVLTVPCGSGNDFARALTMSSVNDAIAAWRGFCSGAQNVKTVDLGVIAALAACQTVPLKDSLRCSMPGTHHYFCSVGGVGLDAATARRSDHLPRWLRGHGGYALSLPGALSRFTAQRVKISLPIAGQPDQFEVHDDRVVMLTAFANTRAYGGGMKIAPRAQMDDGQLDICVIRKMGKLKLFCLFPTVYFGRHLNVRQVDYFQASRLRLETEVPLEVYADGEYVCRTPIEVSVAPGALRVILRPEASF
jgi:diacylglycerol kinase (ATP)